MKATGHVPEAATDGTRDDGTSEEQSTAYRALHSSAAVVLLPRDVVRVSGPDAATYLQGQCSQDVSALRVGGSLESLLLSPQGKVEVYLRITREADDRFVLDTDGGFGSVMVTRLERFRLRTEVAFEPLDWVCAAVRGPAATDALVGQPAFTLPVAWAGLGGVDLLGPLPSGGIDAWVTDAAARCPLGVWEAVRIEAGLPVNGRELNEGTIAAEVGLVDRTVSFTKGCFTGQELVARLDSRGSKVARHLRGVVLADDPVVAARDSTGPPRSLDALSSLAGSAVLTADGEHEVGHLSSVAWSPGFLRVVALATLHRRVEPPEEVLVVMDGASGESRQLPAEVRRLPLELP